MTFPGMFFVFPDCLQGMIHLRNWLETEETDLVEMRGNSSELGHVVYHESLGASFTLLSWMDRVLLLEEAGLSLEFAEQDFLDRIGSSPVNPGKAVELDKTGVLSTHLKDGKLSYTYSERMYYQIDPIVKLLKEYPNTRQAFLSVWSPELDSNRLELERVPCSIGYHFFIRDERLSCLYLMRSLDLDKCLPYDIYTSTRLLEEIANRVGVEPGPMHFWVGSLHRFKTQTIEEEKDA